MGEYKGSGRGVIKNSPFDFGAVVIPPVDGVYAPHYGGIAVFGGGKHGLLCEIARGRRVENGLYAGYFPQDGIGFKKLGYYDAAAFPACQLVIVAVICYFVPLKIHFLYKRGVFRCPYAADKEGDFCIVFLCKVKIGPYIFGAPVYIAHKRQLLFARVHLVYGLSAAGKHRSAVLRGKGRRRKKRKDPCKNYIYRKKFMYPFAQFISTPPKNDMGKHAGI